MFLTFLIFILISLAPPLWSCKLSGFIGASYADNQEMTEDFGVENGKKAPYYGYRVLTEKWRIPSSFHHPF